MSRDVGVLKPPGRCELGSNPVRTIGGCRSVEMADTELESEVFPLQPTYHFFPVLGHLEALLVMYPIPPQSLPPSLLSITAVEEVRWMLTTVGLPQNAV